MRLLILSSEFPPGPGGIATHAYQLARHLIQLGWEVTVITPQDYATDEEIRAFNHSQPFSIIRLRSVPTVPLLAIYRYIKVHSVIRHWRPDILLASGDRAIIMAACITRQFRTPWLAVEHGRIPPRWERPLKRWAFRQATGVVCVSRYTWQRMLAMGIRPRLGRVIPNGADPTRFKILSSREINECRKKLGLDGARVVLTVGNVTERKGQDVIIRALPKVLARVPNAHYVMAGLPTAKEQFERLAGQLGVADHVHFLGRVDTETLVQLLNCCDIFAMTSKHVPTEFEGYGIAVVEAALCGKPAVVSSNSGLVEAVADGETALVVPENDETATAEAILSLLTDEVRRRAMGEAARRRALDEQTWERRVREYDVFLRELLAQHSGKCKTAEGAEMAERSSSCPSCSS